MSAHEHPTSRPPAMPLLAQKLDIEAQLRSATAFRRSDLLRRLAAVDAELEQSTSEVKP